MVKVHFIVVGNIANVVNNACVPDQRAVYFYRCLWFERIGRRDESGVKS